MNVYPCSACEFDDLPPENHFKSTIESFRAAAAFIIDEILSSTEKLEKMSDSEAGMWIDTDGVGSFFELETDAPPFKVQSYS